MVPRTDAILFSGGAQGAEAEFGAAAERRPCVVSSLSLFASRILHGPRSGIIEESGRNVMNLTNLRRPI